MPRKVLSKLLTPNSEQLLNELEQLFCKPIVFHPIEELPNYGYICPYGAVDAYSLDSHKVWLREDLPSDAFEANMFHEVRHIWQIENGFPGVFNKDTVLLHSVERPFFEEVGSHVQSIILDFDVYHWLNSKGYSSEYFISERFAKLLKNKHTEYDHLDDKYNFANLVMAFILFFGLSSDCQKSQAKDAYSRYHSVLSVAEKLSEEIYSMNPCTPQLSAHCMGLLLDRLNLWDTYYITIGDCKIRTAKEFKSFDLTCTLV